MQVSFRVDKGALRPAKRMPDGRLRVDGLITRSGVFKYFNADGSTRLEYRPPDEVFAETALSSFSQVPVTNDHPPHALDASTAKKFTVGMTSENIRKDGDHVAATLMIFDAETIAAMESGKVELSCGYEVDVVCEPGVSPNGERYDAIQRNIRGNHVAIVDVGRAGPEARVRMDSAGTLIDSERRSNMDELQKRLIESLAKIAALELRADTAEKKAQDLELQLAKSEGAFQSEKARADQAESARNDSDKSIGDKVRARVSLETKAANILGADVTAMSDRDIKVAVVKKVDNAEISNERSDEYVAARFDSCVERAIKGGEALNAARVTVDSGKKDAPVDAEATARARMLERSRNAYKEGN
jgi:hypothetical protein